MCVSHLLISLLLWSNLVSCYIILYYVRTNDLADNFQSKIMKMDVFIDLLQDWRPDVCQASIKVIAHLAKFGRLIYYLYHVDPCKN